MTTYACLYIQDYVRCATFEERELSARARFTCRQFVSPAAAASLCHNHQKYFFIEASEHTQILFRNFTTATSTRSPSYESRLSRIQSYFQ